MKMFTMTFEDLGAGYWKGILTDHKDNIISIVESEAIEVDDGFFAHLTECAFIGKMIRDYPEDATPVRDGNWD